MTIRLQINKQARIRKFEPLEVRYTDKGKLILRRWGGLGQPNAVAVEDLPGGGIAIASPGLSRLNNDVIYEVSAMMP